MQRHWSRIGVRVASVGLLVAGAGAGFTLVPSRSEAPRQQAGTVVQADTAEILLLKSRQNQHAAARAWQREAEGEAADKAASMARTGATRAHELATAVKQKKKEKSNALVPYTGPIPTSCEQFVGNRATGCALMLGDGFAIDQFPCLDKLWNKESGWNARAENKGSGAYGIPQAYPGSKMSSIAGDWRTNPATQIKWGLGYVKGKYKSPCGAWTHWQNVGSY